MNVAETFYGIVIEVKVLGTIHFQIPSGFPARTDDQVLLIVRQKLEENGYFDELDLKILGKIKGELLPSIRQRERIISARETNADDLIGTRMRLDKDGEA